MSPGLFPSASAVANKAGTIADEGLVERFNGRISNVLSTRRYVSGEDLKQTLKRYAWLYNHHIPKQVLRHQSPMAAMKGWQVKRPELFTKRLVNHAGLGIDPQPSVNSSKTNAPLFSQTGC